MQVEKFNYLKPDGSLKGESELVEALIRSELVPNSITYIKETYRARRRVYVEDQIRTFFQTPSHVSRVATEIMRGIDDITVVSMQASGLDWSAVFARIRTANLKKSFKNELDQALKKGLDALCRKLITDFPQLTCFEMHWHNTNSRGILLVLSETHTSYERNHISK